MPNTTLESPIDHCVPTHSASESDQSNAALTKKDKIAYGLGSANDAWGNWFLVGAVWVVFNEYLGVAPALISLALMCNRLFDAVSDPFFGWYSDNFRSRWGRRRPFILIGSLLSGLCMFLFFYMIEEGWNNSAVWYENTYFWYLTVGSGILITAVSCFNMPYQSLGAEMSPDYQERTSVFAYRGGIQKISEIANFGAAAFFTLAVFENILHGAKVGGYILGVLMMTIGVIVFRGTRERYYENSVSKCSKRTKIVEAFVGALKCKPFRTQLAMAFSYGTCTSMVSVLGLYTTVFYVCGGNWAMWDDNGALAGGGWNLAMGASMVVCGFAGVPFFSKVSHALTKRKAMIIVLLMSILSFGLTWVLYTPELPYLQLLSSGFNAFTMAGFWMLYGAIGADIIDYDELETGKRREGAFSACGSFFVKIGLAVGMGASGFLLEKIGFDQALGGDQPEGTFTYMRLLLAGIPIIGLLIALYFILTFKLSKVRSAEIRAELEDRRGTV